MNLTSKNEDLLKDMKDFFNSLFDKKNQVKPDESAGTGQTNWNEEELYRPGDVIVGKYEVQRKLGGGSFGIVYLVSSRETKEIYALKTLRDEFLPDATARNAFEREALLWVNLEKHPFVLEARFVEEFSGRLFVGMDFVAPDDQGRVSLEDHLLLSEGLLDTQRVLKWSIQFCYGMEYVNTCGVKVHRDIKPANILITTHFFGGYPPFNLPPRIIDGSLKITDFGLAAGAVAALRGRGSMVNVSANGRPGCSLLQEEGKGWCGTPGYIAPEVYEGKGADVRSDIYSFGVVLWQMAKSSPFSPFHSSEIQYRGNGQEFIMEYQRRVYENQIVGRVPSVGGPLQSVIERCLAFESSGRYRDFKQLRLELQSIFARLGCWPVIPKADEKTAAFWSNKGVNLNTLCLFEEAINCFDKAIQIDLRNAAAWNNKGYSLHSLGRYEDAIHCYDKAIEIDPFFSGAWDNKGNSFQSLGRHQEAVDCFDKAIKFGRARGWREARIWYKRARSEEAAGCIKDAIRSYHEFLDLCTSPRYANLSQYAEQIDYAQQRIKELQ
ncbi:MAG: serine/threonine-protein kinase [Phycisphaerae bacterium]